MRVTACPTLSLCLLPGLLVQVWLPLLLQLVKEAANAVQPAAAAAFGENDPRFYVKVRQGGSDKHQQTSAIEGFGTSLCRRGEFLQVPAPS